MPSAVSADQGKMWDKVAEFVDRHGYRLVRRERRRGADKTLEEVAAFLKKHGCTLITKRYLSTVQPLHYKCDKCGLHGVAEYNRLYRITHFCRRCRSGTYDRYAHRDKQIIFRQKLYSIVEAAHWLGVNYDDFYHAIRYSKRLPAPTRIATVTGLNRFYSEADLKKIKKMIEIV